MVRWDQIDHEALRDGQGIPEGLLRRDGIPSTNLVLRQRDALYVSVARDAVLTESYGAYDLQGRPIDGCFYFRAGLFFHGEPQRLPPPLRRTCTIIPVAIYINNIELRHFGHKLTDGCSSVYPLLRLTRNNRSLSELPIVINRQLADRRQELIDLFGISEQQILVPTVNCKQLLVKQLITPVPSMLNGGTIPDGGYVNREHPGLVKDLLSRLLPPSVHDKKIHTECQDIGNKLYLSRSRLDSERRPFEDEVALEVKLALRGWKIFHPQEHDLSTQLLALKAASCVCATQGSALHLLFGIDPSPALRVVMLSEKQVNVNYTNQFIAQGINHEVLTCLESYGGNQQGWQRYLRLVKAWSPHTLAEALNAKAESDRR